MRTMFALGCAVLLAGCATTPPPDYSSLPPVARYLAETGELIRVSHSSAKVAVALAGRSTVTDNGRTDALRPLYDAAYSEAVYSPDTTAALDAHWAKVHECINAGSGNAYTLTPRLDQCSAELAGLRAKVETSWSRAARSQ